MQNAKMTEAERQVELGRLEALWKEQYVYHPKLPTSALLTGAVAMAMAFGGVMFLAFASMRRHAWIWFVLSVILAGINRVLARRWYGKVLVWDRERKDVAARLKELRKT